MYDVASARAALTTIPRLSPVALRFLLLVFFLTEAQPILRGRFVAALGGKCLECYPSSLVCIKTSHQLSF